MPNAKNGSEDPAHEERILKNQRDETRYWGIRFFVNSGIAVGISQLLGSGMISFEGKWIGIVFMISFIFSVISGWGFLLEGSTLISLDFSGALRPIGKRFQIALSVLLPFALSFYFLESPSDLSLRLLLGYVVNFYYQVQVGLFGLVYLVFLGLIVGFSLKAGELLTLDARAHRGFINASLGLFILCFQLEWLDYSGGPEPPKPGVYFLVYMSFIIVTYILVLKKSLEQEKLGWGRGRDRGAGGGSGSKFSPAEMLGSAESEALRDDLEPSDSRGLTF